MSTFAEGGTVKRKSRPRSTKAAVIYAHTIADELLALWQETLRDVYQNCATSSPIPFEEDLYAVVNALRDLRYEVEQ